MDKEKTVKDIMIPFEEYDKVLINKKLGDVLHILRESQERSCSTSGTFHKTLFVKFADGNIAGKLSMYDLIRGLVPEPAKAPELSKAYHSMLSSRSLEVLEEISDSQEHFSWLQNPFAELVKQESHKMIGDVMKPIRKSVLQLDDKLTQAIYVMFKEDVRQQIIYEGEEIVGVINLNVLFSTLLDSVES
jgi:hypothetical protein